MKKTKTIKFTHLDDYGAACMVNVGNKIPQKRLAMAQGKILLAPTTIKLIKANQIKKGDVLNLARIAGIQAAKLTPQLIPLCHTLLLDQVEIKLQIARDGLVAISKVCCIERTGVEMEALTAVSVALLAIYDMCKAVDKSMKITDVCLLTKVKSDVK